MQSLVKRYGVIFTCLAIRAVHIEVAHSLETDSFLMVLGRFIARSSQVKEIRSDNGTNFTGGERELRESINAWSHNKIHEALYSRRVSSGTSTLPMAPITEVFGSAAFELCARLKLLTTKA